MRVENLLVNNVAFSLATVKIDNNKIVVKGFDHNDEMVVLSVNLEDLRIWHLQVPETKPETEPEPEPEPALTETVAVATEKRKRGRPRKYVLS